MRDFLTSFSLKARHVLKVIYTENAKRRRDAYAAIQNATNDLGKIAGASGDSVTAEWDATNGRQPSYTLKLSDRTGEVQATFTPFEMTVPSPYMRLRLNQLWGDLLKLRHDEVHGELLQLVEQLNGDEGEAADDDGSDQAVITVPAALLPDIRRLISLHKTA